MRVDELSLAAVEAKIRTWADRKESRYMCVSNVHMVMECYDDPAFRAIVNSADLVGADGVPVIRVSRWLGLSRQSRVFAPDLVTCLCRMAAAEGIPVGFYGSTPETLADILGNLRRDFPGLAIAYHHSPPFRPLSTAEAAAVAADINRSGARILFVGLGCPKQERWMNAMRGRVDAAMIGVGWAFDILAGRSTPAPSFIQDIGMEWLYRLASNPAKLWRRHLKNNPRFLVLAALQLMGILRYPAPGPYRSG
jgi:N-acetylglucosaminyldiphosphoundecaprenol N-acetyl-beta-D-mannosaminyltransferase